MATIADEVLPRATTRSHRRPTGNGGLILTRRPGETVIIGEGPDMIVMTTLGVKGNQVRYHIEAPRHVRVDRGEIRDRIEREQRGEIEPRPSEPDGNR